METKINNIFSWSRFCQLYRRDIVENWKVYLLSALAVFGVITISFIIPATAFMAHFPLEEDFVRELSLLEMPVILVSASILSTVVGSIAFRKLRTKQGKIADLMLPASHFEKFAVRWLNVVVLFHVALVLIFILADGARVMLLNLLYPEVSGIEPLTISQALELAGAKEQVIFWLCYYLFTQACYILGSAFMPSYSWIKTYAIMQVVSITLVSIVFMIFGLDALSIAALYKNLYLVIFFTIVFWVLSYYRYKRTQLSYSFF